MIAHQQLCFTYVMCSTVCVASVWLNHSRVVISEEKCVSLQSDSITVVLSFLKRNVCHSSQTQSQSCCHFRGEIRMMSVPSTGLTSQTHQMTYALPRMWVHTVTQIIEEINCITHDSRWGVFEVRWKDRGLNHSRVVISEEKPTWCRCHLPDWHHRCTKWLVHVHACECTQLRK